MSARLLSPRQPTWPPAPQPRPRRLPWLLLLVAISALTSAAALPALGAELTALEVRVEDNLARLDFQLHGAFTDELVDQLESGLPTGFTYRLELVKDRQWFDRGLAESRLQVVAMYDAGNRGYLVNYKLDGKLVESRMVRRLDEVEAAMTEITDLPAFGLAPYPRSWRLLVRVRAAVGARDGFLLPDRALTDWVTTRKFRTLNELPDQP